jgi:hypothetical protein
MYPTCTQKNACHDLLPTWSFHPVALESGTLSLCGEFMFSTRKYGFSINQKTRKEIFYYLLTV